MTLAQPAWLLLLLLLPLVAAGAVLTARLRRRRWHAFVADRLRPALMRTSSPLGRWIAFVLLLAACAALIAALARPEGDAGLRSEVSKGRNILIALDLSRSMRANDLKPDRLTQAKTAIYELLDAMPNDRIGLIGFAGTAHLLAPLTIDHGAIREIVEQADENWVELGGSNFSDMLALSVKTLKETGQKNNALVVLTDGEKHDNALDIAIQEAKRAGIYICAIGFGTDEGSFIPAKNTPNGRLLDSSHREVLSRLQTGVLQRLAEGTNGRFAVAGGGTSVPALVALTASDIKAFEVKGRERRIIVEFYQWLALPAILFLMAAMVAATRWRTFASVVTLFLIAIASPEPAQAGDAGDARDLLAQGNDGAARDAFKQLAANARTPARAARFSLGEGVAAYRKADYAAARNAFSRALLSDDPAVAAAAHHGLGNTLFQIGWKTLAGSPYPADPAQAPGLKEFDTVVRKHLRKLLAAPDGSESGVADLENLAVSWADAISHYNDARGITPGNSDLAHNSDTTLVFYKRLMELLKEEEQATADSIPQPQPSPSPGKSGNDPNSPGEKDDSSGDKDKGDKDKGDKDKGDKDKGDKDKGDKGKAGDGAKAGGDKEKDNKSGKDDGRGKDGSGKTPEEQARGQLKDNADLQKGPPRSGRRIPSSPIKDW